VSLEEVLLVRGSLLHIDETEAVLLQLLRHLLPYQGKDCRWLGDDLNARQILLDSSGLVQLERNSINKRWSVRQMAEVLARVCMGIGVRTPIHDLADPFLRPVSIERAIQVLKERIQPAAAARVVAALYGEVLGSSSHLNGKSGEGEGYSTEDSAISSDHFSRHPSSDSLTTSQVCKIPSDSAASAPGGSGCKVEELSPDFVFRRRRPIRITRARSTVEGALKSWSASKMQQPILRAPSRLYQLGSNVDGATVAAAAAAAAAAGKVQPTATATIHPLRKTLSCLDLNVNMPADPEQDPCCGPEFIVKSSLPPHTVILNSNPKKRRAVAILLLDGRRIQVECDPAKTKISQLFQLVVNYLGIHVSDVVFFGLSTIKNGQFFFPREDEKVNTLAPDNYKQLPYSTFNIYFRFRFYIHSTLYFHNVECEHWLYLQLRKDVLEQRWTVTVVEEIGLAALALSIEFGTFQRKIHGGGSYFDIDHYLSENAQRSASGAQSVMQTLERLHQQIPAVDRRVAHTTFIRKIIQSPSYGYHRIHVIEDDGLRTTPLNLLVGLEGLQMIPHPSAAAAIPANKLVQIRWVDIKSLTHTKHHILVTVLLASATKKTQILRRYHQMSRYIPHDHVTPENGTGPQIS